MEEGVEAGFAFGRKRGKRWGREEEEEDEEEEEEEEDEDEEEGKVGGRRRRRSWSHVMRQQQHHHLENVHRLCVEGGGEGGREGGVFAFSAAVEVAREGGKEDEMPVYAVLRVMDRKGKEEVGQGVLCLAEAFESSRRRKGGRKGGKEGGREGVPITMDVTNGGRLMGVLRLRVEAWEGGRKGGRGVEKVKESWKLKGADLEAGLGGAGREGGRGVVGTNVKKAWVSPLVWGRVKEEDEEE